MFRFLLFVLSCTFLANTCNADVSSLRSNRFGRLRERSQRQQAANPTPYPAAGFQPERQFHLPTDQSQFDGDQNEEVQRPDLKYGAPSQLLEFDLARQQIDPAGSQFYVEPQRSYAAPAAGQSQRIVQQLQPARLRTAQSVSARLSDNREDQEDDDDTVEVNENQQKMVEANGKSAEPAQPVASVTYFPGGAVSFVQPGSPQGNFIQQTQPVGFVRTQQGAVTTAPVIAARFAAEPAIDPRFVQYSTQPQILEPSVAPNPIASARLIVSPPQYAASRLIAAPAQYAATAPKFANSAQLAVAPAAQFATIPAASFANIPQPAQYATIPAAVSQARLALAPRQIPVAEAPARLTVAPSQFFTYPVESGSARLIATPVEYEGKPAQATPARLAGIPAPVSAPARYANAANAAAPLAQPQVFSSPYIQYVVETPAQLQAW